ncbi:hypothetical protein SRHO_G00154040 [Serrasalmus rhombeus]
MHHCLVLQLHCTPEELQFKVISPSIPLRVYQELCVRECEVQKILTFRSSCSSSSSVEALADGQTFFSALQGLEKHSYRNCASSWTAGASRFHVASL